MTGGGPTGITQGFSEMSITRRYLLRPILATGFCLSICTCANQPVVDPSIPVFERDISGGLHDIAPIRGELRPLKLHIDEDAIECSMCHEGFTGDLGDAALEGAHADIVFDHGRNVLCLNCHHPENSDAYVDFGGEEIAGDNPTQLCAKCHGPHFREWNHDVHGRVNAYWDSRFGEQKKLACVQCHDPHRPRFPQMAPEPPPRLTRFDALNQGALTDVE